MKIFNKIMLCMTIASVQHVTAAQQELITLFDPQTNMISQQMAYRYNEQYYHFDPTTNPFSKPYMVYEEDQAGPQHICPSLSTSPSYTPQPQNQTQTFLHDPRIIKLAKLYDQHDQINHQLTRFLQEDNPEEKQVNEYKTQLNALGEKITAIQNSYLPEQPALSARFFSLLKTIKETITNYPKISAITATAIPFFVTRNFWINCYNAGKKGAALIVFLGSMISVGAYGMYHQWRIISSFTGSDK